MRIGRATLLVVTLAITALVVAACGSDPETGNAPASAPNATLQPTSAPSPAELPTAGPGLVPADDGVVVQDFELPRAGGGSVRLSDVYADGNTVLVFYRGYF